MALLSERVRRIGVSPTLRISGQARRMRADGIDVTDLSIGEPDFNSPDVAKKAGIAAIEANRTHYTPTPGTPELRRAITGWIDRHLGVRYDEADILVSNGAKHSIANLMLALIDPGDEVIIPAPWWVSYPELAGLAGGRSVFVETREEEGFLMSPEALREKLTPRTKLLMLNNPSNPTGSTYPTTTGLSVVKSYRNPWAFRSPLSMTSVPRYCVLTALPIQNCIGSAPLARKGGR